MKRNFGNFAKRNMYLRRKYEAAAALAAQREKDKRTAWLTEVDSQDHEWEHVELNYSNFDIEFLEALRIDRDTLEKLVYKPTFEKVIIGCVVRVSITNVHQVAEILGAKKTGEPYVIGKELTKSRLIVKIKDKQHLIEMVDVSNEKISLNEYLDWKLSLEDLQMPSITYIKHKVIAIQKLVLYELSPEQKKEVDKEKHVMRLPLQNTTLKKMSLIADRREAFQTGNHELADVLTEGIASIDRQNEEEMKAKTGHLTAISYMNARNRVKNFENAIKARGNNTNETQTLGDYDPFIRRKTCFRMTNPEEDERANPAPAPEPESIPAAAKRQKPDMMPHDFEINLDIPIPGNDLEIQQRPVKPVSPATEIISPLQKVIDDCKKIMGLRNYTLSSENKARKNNADGSQLLKLPDPEPIPPAAKRQKPDMLPNFKIDLDIPIPGNDLEKQPRPVKPVQIETDSLAPLRKVVSDFKKRMGLP